MNDIVPSDGQKQIKHYLRHFVALVWTNVAHSARAKSQLSLPTTDFASGFVISADGQWAWITAGHVLSHIDEMQAEGVEIHTPRFFDKWTFPISKADQGVPTHIEKGRWFWKYDAVTGADYGGVLLNDIEVALLKNAGIEPLYEAFWENVPSVVNGYEIFQLLGIPRELTTNDSHQHGPKVTVVGSCKPALAPISFEPHPPQELLLEHPRFFGRLRDDMVPNDRAEGYPLDSIKGMSGGPIFGLWRAEDSHIHYRVVGIQSGWLEQQRLVTACSVAHIANVIRDFNRKQTITSV